MLQCSGSSCCQWSRRTYCPRTRQSCYLFPAICLLFRASTTGIEIRDKCRYIFIYSLNNKVAKLAAVLSSYGVTKGDRVLIYMPMIPEAVVAMLAVVRLGAIHSLVFGGEDGRQ